MTVVTAAFEGTEEKFCDFWKVGSMEHVIRRLRDVPLQNKFAFDYLGKAVEISLASLAMA